MNVMLFICFCSLAEFTCFIYTMCNEMLKIQLATQLTFKEEKNTHLTRVNIKMTMLLSRDRWP